MDRILTFDWVPEICRLKNYSTPHDTNGYPTAIVLNEGRGNPFPHVSFSVPKQMEKKKEKKGEGENTGDLNIKQQHSTA